MYLLDTHNRNFKVAALGLAGLLVIVVTYYGGFAQQLSKALEPRDLAGVRPLVMGTNVWPGYEPFYLARDLGYYQQDHIRLVEYSSATQVLQAFRNGAVDVGALTLDEVLTLRQDGHQVQVILVTDISTGADAILARSPVETLADISGQKVGVENTALGGYMLTRALQSVGLSVDDVQVIPLEVHEHDRAFDRGEIDVVVTFEPVRSRLLSRGARQLFDSSQIPDEVVDVLVVRTGDIDPYRTQLITLLQGWFLALDHLEHHPSDAAQRMAARLKLSPDDILSAYDGLRLPSHQKNKQLLSGPHSPIRQLGDRLATVMTGSGLLRAGVNVDNLCESGLLDGVEPHVSP